MLTLAARPISISGTGGPPVDTLTFRKPDGYWSSSLERIRHKQWDSNLQRWGACDLKSPTVTTRPLRHLPHPKHIIFRKQNNAQENDGVKYYLSEILEIWVSSPHPIIAKCPDVRTESVDWIVNAHNSSTPDESKVLFIKVWKHIILSASICQSIFPRVYMYYITGSWWIFDALCKVSKAR